MTDSGEVDITPSTDVLISWRSQDLSRAHVLGELLDNAFDWNAEVVTIEISGKDLIVSDDGDGCGDLQHMLTAGRSSRGGRARVGRFGVGLKDSAIWLGGTTQIRSVHGGVVRSVIADWDAIARSHKWKIPSPREQRAEPGDRGTRITFANIGRDLNKGIAALIVEVGYLFTPALKSGKQIIFRTKGKSTPAPRYEKPRLEREVDRKISVGGKEARVCVGVIPDGDPTPSRPGISYTHLHRVIIPACGLGCAGRSHSRVWGWVSLDGRWALNKNKNGINVDEEILGEAVYSVIADIVDMAARQSMSIRSASIAANLTAMLRGAIERGDASRDQTGEKPGPITPKKTGREHKNARKSRPGTSRRIVNLGRISVDFKPCEQPDIGSVDLRGPVVWLADNHPRVAKLRERGNEEALLEIALALLAEASRDPSAQMAFRGEAWRAESGEVSFPKAYGQLLSDHATPTSAPRQTNVRAASVVAAN